MAISTTMRLRWSQLPSDIYGFVFAPEVRNIGRKQQLQKIQLPHQRCGMWFSNLQKIRKHIWCHIQYQMFLKTINILHGMNVSCDDLPDCLYNG